MADFALNPELLRLAPSMLLAGFRLLAQRGDPYAPYYDEHGGYYAEPQEDTSLSIGTIIFAVLGGAAINALFGFWAKSRAEEYDVDPWLGFALGFVLGWIGVLIVPLFRKHRLFVNKRSPVAVGYSQPMHAPNPLYSAPVAAAGPYPAYPPPPGMPPAAPYPEPPAAPPQMLIADASGYVNCPGCGSRTKAGRKSCMNCGGFMPPVYNPHIK